MEICRNCAKIFCENRDDIYECNEKITFVQANILDKPERKGNNENLE